MFSPHPATSINLLSLLLLTGCTNTVMPRKADPQVVLNNFAGTYVNRSFSNKNAGIDNVKKLVQEIELYQCGTTALPDLEAYRLRDFIRVRRLDVNDYELCAVVTSERLLMDIGGYNPRVKAFVVEYRGNISGVDYLFPDRDYSETLTLKMASPESHSVKFILNDGQQVAIKNSWDGEVLFNDTQYSTTSLRIAESYRLIDTYSIGLFLRVPSAQKPGHSWHMPVNGGFKLEPILLPLADK